MLEGGKRGKKWKRTEGYFRGDESVLRLIWGDISTYTVKNLPAMHETQVRSLSGEDPLEKGMATHSGMLAWKIP